MTKKIAPYFIILLAVCIFFWKIIFQGMVAMPGDLLSGAYYPWLEYKYGYQVGVPVKNGLISDVFSQYYVWKGLITESYSNLTVPLWNPYSYSGYPLLANFHSGALYIFNLLFVPFKLSTGWNLYIISEILGSAIAMYILLRTFKYSFSPSLLGSLAYAFSGYSVVWMQFGTVGQSLIWLPLLLAVVEKYFQTKNYRWLFLTSPILFLLTTAGHFQIMTYGYVLYVAYFLFKFITAPDRKIKDLIIFSISIILGVGMATIQLLPTIELSSLSVRFNEHYIEALNYGLIPVKNLITLFAPDFFGNPTTGNYWGVWNYNETAMYVGILPLMALVWSIFSFSKLEKRVKFFLTTGIIALLLSLDTPVGKIIYTLKVPGLSTSAAGRVIAVFSLSTSVLLATFVQKIRTDGLRKILLRISPLLMLICFTLLFTILLKYTNLLNNLEFLLKEKENVNIIFRNLILPSFLIGGFLLVIIMRKNRFYYTFFILMLVFDLFRFGWKYTPFVPEKLIFPNTEVTDFLEKQSGIFRIEKIFGEIMPPNTWTYYHLMSPSGYDPMALEMYTKRFYKDFVGVEDASSRYAEIRNYNSKALGDYNVKYLLAIKRDEKGVIPGNNIDYRIDSNLWKRVFETSAVAVLQNSEYKERAYLESKGGQNMPDSVTIDTYLPEKVAISYEASVPSNLILLDTWYPGWKVTVNGKEEVIEKYHEIFRMVHVPGGSGEVIFEYSPKSFRYGFYIFIASAVIWGLLFKSTVFLNPKPVQVKSKNGKKSI